MQYQDKISKNCQREVSLTMICDRSIDKKKFESQTIKFSSDIMDVIDSDCDLIVELIGGTEIAYALVKEHK